MGMGVASVHGPGTVEPVTSAPQPRSGRGRGGGESRGRGRGRGQGHDGSGGGSGDGTEAHGGSGGSGASGGSGDAQRPDMTYENKKRSQQTTVIIDYKRRCAIHGVTQETARV